MASSLFSRRRSPLPVHTASCSVFLFCLLVRASSVCLSCSPVDARSERFCLSQAANDHQPSYHQLGKHSETFSAFGLLFWCTPLINCNLCLSKLRQREACEAPRSGFGRLTSKRLSPEVIQIFSLCKLISDCLSVLTWNSHIDFSLGILTFNLHVLNQLVVGVDGVESGHCGSLDENQTRICSNLLRLF